MTLLPVETFEGYVFVVVFFTCFNCNSNLWFSQDESEFRDKLTPITIFMEYRLDYRTAADATGLHPILNQFTPANMSRQVYSLHDLWWENPERIFSFQYLFNTYVHLGTSEKLRYQNIHLGFSLWIMEILMVIVCLSSFFPSLCVKFLFWYIIP